MKIATKYFEEMSLEENEVITFPQGIFGFENNKKFIIIRFDNEDNSILCLQSTEEEQLAFVLINPFYLDMDYKPELTEIDYKDIKANEESDLSFYTICVVRENFEESTVNLKCPVIVNCDTRIAKQVILDSNDYSMRQTVGSFKEEE